MNVLLIGTGRLAFHLGHALKHAGFALAGIAGRDTSKAGVLADALGCPAFPLSGTLPTAEIRIIAVRDDAIASVSASLPKDKAVTIHTSGAKPWDLIQGSAHRGVLWPVQSFSAGEPMDFSGVPLVIDAEDEQARTALEAIANGLSSTVVELPTAKRVSVHTAAVLASNFPVWSLMEAERLLKDQGLSPSLVHALFQGATARAALNAEQALTGPARRGDITTIREHLAGLTSDPDLRRAYAQLSAMILKAYGHPTDGIEDVQGDPR
jgi:predicted short-subunit dehydrogenase-like oxidoreductase (DUF2520 family)